MIEIDTEPFQQITRVIASPPIIEVAYGPDREWEYYQQYGQEVAGRARDVRPQPGHPACCRHLGIVDEYAAFAAAAERLLLDRQGQAPASGVSRGLPIATREVPLKPRTPTGWMARPSGLSVWKALEARVANYVGAHRRRGPQAAQRHWPMVQVLVNKAATQPRILDAIRGLTCNGHDQAIVLATESHQ